MDNLKIFMAHRVVYSADLHGNEVQYGLLVGHAIKQRADSVIIGGDICPKGWNEDYVGMQRRFLEERLPKLLGPLREALPGTGIYLMMGNDDCAVNLDVLTEKADGLYEVIHDRRISLGNGFDLVGYGFVPITPFGIKDWEKFDLSDVPEGVREEYEKRKAGNYRLDGGRSVEGGFVDFTFNENMEGSDSIQIDLGRNWFVENAGKTVYVMHSPPNNTCLDRIHGGHVGSFAIREFIERAQPYLTCMGIFMKLLNYLGNIERKLGRVFQCLRETIMLGKSFGFWILIWKIWEVWKGKD
jgi:Icc-related predicted phosphoesterase